MLFLSYIFLGIISYVFSIIPNWNFTNSAINLFSSNSTIEYQVSYRGMYCLIIELYKKLTKSGNNITEQNYIRCYTYIGVDQSTLIPYGGPMNVDFDDIESLYNEHVNGKVICPKGKYHLYYINEERFIIPQGFVENGNWDLKCYMHKTENFLLFYKMNGDINFYWTNKDYTNLTKVEGVFGEELFDFKLKNGERSDSEYPIASLIKKSGYLTLNGGKIKFSNNMEYTSCGNLNIIQMKNHTQAIFQNFSDNFFFFTYNNVSDFISGYSTEQPGEDEYNNVSKYSFVINDESPFEFLGNVEILEMQFSSGNQYVSYKIYDKENYINYTGIIDIKLNKVMFNTDTDIQKFISYNNYSMLAITSTGAYQICTTKSGNTCIESCTSQSNILDTDGNTCGSGCPNGKIKLLPSEVCFDECDLSINIKNSTHCGLCKYFYEDKIYKLHNDISGKCFSTIPDFAEEYNSNLHLLECKKGWNFDPDLNTCIECLNETKYKCEICNNKSNTYSLCLTCKEGFLKVNYTKKYSEFLDCVEINSPLLKKYYYDENKDEYKPCYQTCKNCTIGGNEEMNNCLSCINGYMKRPGDNPYNNCVAQSKYYYVDSYGQYKTMDNFQCPELAKYAITDRNSCIDDCKNDPEYKYLFNGHCYKNCSEVGTKYFDYEENYQCKVKPESCSLGKSKLYLNDDNLNITELLVKTYLSEFNYTEKHISFYENKNYSIIIFNYNSSYCIKNLGLKIPTINFKYCYTKVQEAYNLNDSLIIVIAEKKDLKNPTTLFSFFHPKSGFKLEATKICSGASIEIGENLKEFLDPNDIYYDTHLSLLEQGINIFDLDDPFFNDICYDFENPLKKDIALSDRIKEIYPNATSCDQGCQARAIDFYDLTVSCDCSYNDLQNSNIENNEFLESLMGDALKYLISSNIQVLKCGKYIFKHFAESAGAWISLVIIICHSVMAVLYFIIDSKKMKIYVFSMTTNYLSYIRKKHIHKGEPPRKHKSSKDTNDILISNKSLDKKNNVSQQGNSKLKLAIKKEEDNKLNIFNKKSKDNKSILKIAKLNNITIHKTKKKFFEEYMSTSPDDMFYDDAKVLDKRTFSEKFTECLQEKQIIAYTFLAVDPLIPKTIKIIVLFLNIILYFVVNGLFFSEEVISQLYNSKDENFFSFFVRSYEQIIYSALVGIVLGYLTDFFFVEEKKIKGIFRREKDNHVILKQNINDFLKNIKIRYIAFIVVASVIFLLSFYYLLCFNYVYPYTQIEWIKSSITVVIIMQLLSFLKCLLESGLRALSFKLKSEKIYKVSKLLD